MPPLADATLLVASNCMDIIFNAQSANFSVLVLKPKSLQICFDCVILSSVLKDDEPPKEVAMKITQHIVAEINKYERLVRTTDVGKKMKNLEDKYGTE